MIPLLMLFAQRHTRNVVSVILCYNTSFSSFMWTREERRELGAYCSVLLKVWNVYLICFIILTFVSHLTSLKMLATINLRLDDDKEVIKTIRFLLELSPCLSKCYDTRTT